MSPIKYHTVRYFRYMHRYTFNTLGLTLHHSVRYCQSAATLNRSVLTHDALKRIQVQKGLQDPKMNFKDAADDLLVLRNVMSTRSEQFCLDAL